MYCLKRSEYDYDPQGEHTLVSLEYYTYDGWRRFDKQPIDLKGVVLFTKREAQVNELPPNEEFQWYGAYKR